MQKTFLALEAFATSGHSNEDPHSQEALKAPCLSATGQCQQVIPDYSGEANNNAALDIDNLASNAWFCKQPSGHSLTCSSTFDCLLAGNIPVMFANRSSLPFPRSHMPDASKMVLLLSRKTVTTVFSSILVGINVYTQNQTLESTAKFAHLYQYSSTPHSGLIGWDNVGQISKWDDAFTFTLKSLIQRVQSHDWLQDAPLTLMA